MGRVAVRELLASYPKLNELGIDEDKIWPNFALDRSPRRDGVWLILRWGPSADRFGKFSGKRTLNIWGYESRQNGTDYSGIDLVLGAVIEAMISTVEFFGSDGSVLRTADFHGLSGDLVDNGYDAIARSAEFSVLIGNAP